MSRLSLVTEGDTHVVVTRHFAAAPKLVYQAHITPELLQQWCTGPEGWTMPVCECDAHPGGKIHYEWQHPDQGSFSLTGEFIALDPYERIEHVERMHLPDTTPDNHVVTTFASDGTGTLMTMRITLPCKEAREMMLATGMEGGMEESYVRMEKVLGGA